MQTKRSKMATVLTFLFGRTLHSPIAVTVEKWRQQDQRSKPSHLVENKVPLDFGQEGEADGELSKSATGTRLNVDTEPFKNGIPEFGLGPD